MKISIFGDTIVGKQRDHNEDSLLIQCDINKQWHEINDQQIDISESRGLIFAVADGMGGTNAGEVASAIAVNTLKERIATIPAGIKRAEQIRRILNSIILAIHNNIIKEAKEHKEKKGMGTTIVLGWILNNILYIIWIGDSRCYHYNKTATSQLTPFSEDHSLVWSRVKSGEITPEEARLSSESNLLLQSLGDTYQYPHPEFKFIELAKNDRILLCSDGLNSMLSTVGIQQILDFSDSTKETCQSLINSANNAGGHDNITAILIDIIGTDLTLKPPFRKKLFNKRRLAKLITFMALAVFIAGLFFIGRKLNYTIDLKKIALSLTQKEIKNTIVNNDSCFAPGQSDTINIYYPHSLEVIAKKDFEKISVSTKITSVNSSSAWIPERAVQSLQTAIDQIKKIERKIEPVQPNKSEYQPEFYLIHSKSLESILHSLDSLKNYVRGYAEIKDNKIIRLKDFKIREKNIYSILRTIDSLNSVTEDILSSQ